MPFTAIRISPYCTPARAAGLPGRQPSTGTPFSRDAIRVTSSHFNILSNCTAGIRRDRYRRRCHPLPRVREQCRSLTAVTVVLLHLGHHPVELPGGDVGSAVLALPGLRNV